MKHVSRVTILALSLLVPFLYGGQAFARTVSVTGELHVRAVVPDHRDIVLNTKGDILEITSNTLKDVPPTVYAGSIAPENKVELTDALYKKYRQHVPEGTAKYGVLYKNTSVLARLGIQSSRS